MLLCCIRPTSYCRVSTLLVTVRTPDAGTLVLISIQSLPHLKRQVNFY